MKFRPEERMPLSGAVVHGWVRSASVSILGSMVYDPERLRAVGLEVLIAPEPSAPEPTAPLIQDRLPSVDVDGFFANLGALQAAHDALNPIIAQAFEGPLVDGFDLIDEAALFALVNGLPFEGAQVSAISTGADTAIGTVPTTTREAELTTADGLELSVNQGRRTEGDSAIGDALPSDVHDGGVAKRGRSAASSQASSTSVPVQAKKARH